MEHALSTASSRSVKVFPFTEKGLSGSFVVSIFGGAMPPIAVAVPVGAGPVEVEETKTVVVLAGTAVSVSCLSVLRGLGFVLVLFWRGESAGGVGVGMLFGLIMSLFSAQLVFSLCGVI